MAHKIRHRQIGEGPILVLLHGYGGNVRHWKGIIEKLKAHYCLVTPNLSQLFLSPVRLYFSVQVELVAQYLRKNFLGKRVILGGFSYGAALSWAVASQYPELVDKIILINPIVPDAKDKFVLPEIRYFFAGPVTEKSLHSLVTTPIGRDLLKTFAVAFREERAKGAGAVEKLKGQKLVFAANLIYGLIWTLRNENWKIWQGKLQKIKGVVPSLLIYGREDKIFSPEIYKSFAEEIGAKTVHEVSGAGHLAITSNPDLISTLIREFTWGKAFDISLDKKKAG